MGKNQRFDSFVANVYLPEIKNRKRSWAIDERVWRQRLSGKFGKRPLAAITMADVEDWLRRLADSGISPSTCNRYFAVLKSIFSMALKRGLIASSPCANVKRFKEPPAKEKFLPVHLGRILLATLLASACLAAKALCLLILTGARKGEILQARWENVDFERRILTVPVSKSNKPRHIALSREAIGILRKLPRVSPWVFPNKSGTGHLSDVYRFWDKIRVELGLREYRIHDLRHSFASYLVGEGHTLYEAQMALGHATPITTMRYAHLAESALHACAKTVGLLLLGNYESGKIRGKRSKMICVRKQRGKAVANQNFLCRFKIKSIK